MSHAVDGVLVVDKPEGVTSHDVVAAVRRRLPRGTRVGHTGTLDPFATGVLPVVIGKATRLSQFLTASRKRYLATVSFGAETDSGDVTGQVTHTVPREALAELGAAAIGAALAGLVEGSPQGLAETKRLLTADLVARIDRDGESAAQRSAELFASPEAQRAMRAFLSRSGPRAG